MDKDFEVIIVGAGLAGLSCAKYLKDKGISFVVLEAAGHAGGRVDTDSFDGYVLDRGFQVLLTSYPEAQAILNYEELELKRFEPGALVRYDGNFYNVADPFRAPSFIFDTLCAPIGTLKDKINIAKLKLRLSKQTISQILSAPEDTTANYLRKNGFSPAIIERFFRPFFSGVFLENDLSTSSRLFNLFFKMFSIGYTAVPRFGMREIPCQIAEQVGYKNIRFYSRVEMVRENAVFLASGEKLSAPNIVLALDASTAADLAYGVNSDLPSKSTTCMYYSADSPPISEAILVLNGDKHGPINSLCVLTNVSPSYAPAGKSLISISIIGDPVLEDDELQQQVVSQLVEWFGNSVESWKHLRTYRVRNALPIFPPGTDFLRVQTELKPGFYVCGDHMSTGSINGALESGRLVAEHIAQNVFSKVAGVA